MAENKTYWAYLKFVPCYNNSGTFEILGLCASMLHSEQKCLPRVACLWSKLPMFQRVGMSTTIFDSYDMKTFKFGHDFFNGFKMPRLWTKRFSISFHKMAEKLAILKPLKISWQGIHIIRIKYAMLVGVAPLIPVQSVSTFRRHW